MEKITLWKGSLFKEVSREKMIEKLENAISENQDENKEFSGLLQDIIKRIDCINTIQFYNDGTVRIHYKDSYNQRTPSDFIKGESAALFNDVIFLDGENRSNDKEEIKKMQWNLLIIIDSRLLPKR